MGDAIGMHRTAFANLGLLYHILAKILEVVCVKSTKSYYQLGL